MVEDSNVLDVKSHLGKSMELALFGLTPGVSNQAKAFFQSDSLIANFSEYSACLTTVIQASVPLMQEARSCCLVGSVQMNPSIAARFVDYYQEHIEEETDHDIWFEEDLAHLGMQLDNNWPRSRLVAAKMVGLQYYLIRHVSPVALLGYIAAIEWNAPHSKLAGNLEERLGFPKGALRTMRLHTELDGGHTQALFDFAGSVELEANDKALIIENLKSTLQSLTDMFEALSINRNLN